MNGKNDPNEEDLNMNSKNDLDRAYNDDVDSIREHEFPMLKGSNNRIEHTQQTAYRHFRHHLP